MGLVHFEGLAWCGTTLEARASSIKDLASRFAQLLQFFDLVQLPELIKFVQTL
jgi:hypothetical protein